MRILTVTIVVSFCLLVGPVLAAPPDPSGNGPVHLRIENQVVDLLNEEIVLDSIDGPTVWESESFDTSDYNRIGLRFSTEMEEGFVTCRVCWKFSDDDDFRDGTPAVTLREGNLPYSPWNPFEIGDDPSLRVRVNPYFDPATDFSEVRGLQAKVKCSLSIIVIDFGDVGEDPGGDEPPEPEPLDITASLTDVKVLLRRE
jgi:hypothetical protein